jgi:hypothetical protein
MLRERRPAPTIAPISDGIANNLGFVAVLEQVNEFMRGRYSQGPLFECNAGIADS